MGPLPAPDAGDARQLSGRRESLCARFVDRLAVTGASITVFDAVGHQSTICSTDAVASAVEELQFTMGEGPHWLALHTGRPVLVPDVRHQQAEWPAIGPAVCDAGVGALFAFPLLIGAATVGVVDLYRSTSGKLSAHDVSTAASLAGSVAGPAVRQAIRAADEAAPPELDVVPEMRREVQQATGMLLAQLNVTATEAFLRLRAYAFSSGRPVQDVARDVIGYRLDLSKDSDE